MASHTVIHVSDLHLLADGLLFGAVDCEANLQRFVAQVVRSRVRPDAIVVTGDVADQAEPAAYETAKRLLEPLAEDLGCPLVWVMGNHDHRVRFRDALLADVGTRPGPEVSPNDHVTVLDGLRVVALDSTVPGYHHGLLAGETLDWLRDELSVPAAGGTLLALHHPPLPTTLEFLGFLDLRNRDELAEVVRGSDVRAILAGHWHLSAEGTLAGVPVLVAGATSYSTNPAAPPDSFEGVDAGQSYRVVELVDDRVSSTVVPIVAAPAVSSVPRSDVAAARSLDAAARDASVSRFAVTDLDR